MIWRGLFLPDSWGGVAHRVTRRAGRVAGPARDGPPADALDICQWVLPATPLARGPQRPGLSLVTAFYQA